VQRVTPVVSRVLVGAGGAWTPRRVHLTASVDPA